MTKRALFIAIVAAGLYCPSSLAQAPAGQYKSFNSLDTEIVDQKTKLTWRRRISDQGLTYDQAVADCDLGFRVPTIKELQTLVDEQPTFSGRYLDANAFPPNTTPVGAHYWSSTPQNVGAEKGHAALTFTDATTKAFVDATQDLLVLCVRGPT